MIFIWFRGSRGMGFLSMMFLMLGLAILPLLFFVALGGVGLEQINREHSYKQQYGEAWKSHFEADRGSLSDARTKAVVCAAGAIVVAGLYVYLYKQISGAIRRRMGTAPRKRKRRRSSSRSMTRSSS